MKKVVLAGAGAAAAMSLAVLGAVPANAAPPDVSGETYAKAVQILHSQGFSTVFGGSVGSDQPQNKCIVSDQSLIPSGKVRLRLDCTKAAAEAADPPTTGAPGAPDGPAVVPGAAPVPGGFPQVGVPVAVG